MRKQRKKIGIGEHKNDSSIPMVVFNSSLSGIGDCELLAENTTTDFTSYTIKNLSNYK